MHRPSSIVPMARRSEARALLGRLSAFALAFLSFSLPSVVCAQSTNGSLSGRVTDASQAVIVDATVVAIRVDTNVLYETATNTTGNYVLTTLTPARTASKSKKWGSGRSSSRR